MFSVDTRWASAACATGPSPGMGVVRMRTTLVVIIGGVIVTPTKLGGPAPGVKNSVCLESVLSALSYRFGMAEGTMEAEVMAACCSEVGGCVVASPAMIEAVMVVVGVIGAERPMVVSTGSVIMTCCRGGRLRCLTV